MLGLGETLQEILETMDDLRAVGVDIINIGQYLQPTRNNIPVQKYWTPEEFSSLRDAAREKGFLHCEAGPLVRSSYHAAEQLDGFREHLGELKARRERAGDPRTAAERRT
jgi:lipoic acid synthetase